MQKFWDRIIPIIFFFAIVILIGFAVWLFSPQNGEARTADSTQLGRALDFPEGYRLITAYTYGGDGRFTVYICASNLNNEYRECIPSIKKPE